MRPALTSICAVVMACTKGGTSIGHSDAWKVRCVEHVDPSGPGVEPSTASGWTRVMFTNTCVCGSDSGFELAPPSILRKGLSTNDGKSLIQAKGTRKILVGDLVEFCIAKDDFGQTAVYVSDCRVLSKKR